MAPAKAMTKATATKPHTGEICAKATAIEPPSTPTTNIISMSMALCEGLASLFTVMNIPITMTAITATVRIASIIYPLYDFILKTIIPPKGAQVKGRGPSVRLITLFLHFPTDGSKKLLTHRALSAKITA